MTRALCVLLVLLALATPAFAQTTTPQPTPTGIPIPQDLMADGLQDADDLLAEANVSLAAPDGSPLLPQDNTSLVMGYAKWITSPAAADEITGSFSPIFKTIGFWLQMAIVLLTVYIAVYVGIYLIRWIVWIFKLILQLISAISSVAGGVVSWLLKFIGV